MAYTAAQRKADYAVVFNTPTGEKVLDDLLNRYNFLGSTHCIGDAHQTEYLNGQRDVMLYVLKCLCCKPSTVPDMVQRISGRDDRGSSSR